MPGKGHAAAAPRERNSSDSICTTFSMLTRDFRFGKIDEGHGGYLRLYSSALNCTIERWKQPGGRENGQSIAGTPATRLRCAGAGLNQARALGDAGRRLDNGASRQKSTGYSIKLNSIPVGEWDGTLMLLPPFAEREEEPTRQLSSLEEA